MKWASTDGVKWGASPWFYVVFFYLAYKPDQRISSAVCPVRPKMASGNGSRSTVVDSHGLSARSAVTILRLYPIRVVWGVGGHGLTLSGEFCDETSIFGPAQALTMALAFRMAATAWAFYAT